MDPRRLTRPQYAKLQQDMEGMRTRDKRETRCTINGLVHRVRLYRLSRNGAFVVEEMIYLPDDACDSTLVKYHDLAEACLAHRRKADRLFIKKLMVESPGLTA